MTPDRLKAYADQHGITWKGSAKKDGKHWRAKLQFSDKNEIYHGTGFSKEEAVERAVDHAISARGKPFNFGPPSINVREGR